MGPGVAQRPRAQVRTPTAGHRSLHTTVFSFGASVEDAR